MLLTPRYLPRLAALVGLFTRYGLADFAQEQGLGLLTPEELEPEQGEELAEVRDRAAAFRRRLVELGPAYIKLGQVLSTRPDLLPEPYIRELEHLQDDVPTTPLDEIEKTIELELGARISKLFASFDPDPIGSASLGQVHAAELRDGRSVVVKVQRPNIREPLAEDLAFFREVAEFLTKHTAAGQRIDMVGIIHQLELALSDELDYRIEARNAASFRVALAEFPRLLIPKVIEAYTTDRVLTTERIRGVKVGDVSPLSRLDHDFRGLADELGKAYLKQITIDGHFHADPHPGNIFVVFPSEENPRTPAEVVATDRRLTPRAPTTPLSRLEAIAQQEAADAGAPPRENDVRLALIDFGMTARLSDAMREQVVRLLMEVSDNRGDDAAGTLIEMGDQLDWFDRGTYVREIGTLVARSYDLAIGEIQAGRLLYEVINISYRSGLRLPAELTLLAKTLFNLDAVTRALDPTYSPVTAIREFGAQIVNERARRELSPRHVFEIMSESADLLAALPHRVDLISQRLAANELGLTIDIPQTVTLLKGMQKIANRIFSGLVLGGLLVASAMLLPYRRTLGTMGFVIAALIGLWMVLTIVVSDRHGRPRS